MKKRDEKDFLFYGLRVGFWLMIAFYILYYSLVPETEFLTFGDVFGILLILFTFVLSILNVVQKKKKTFAIVALVISSIYLLLFLIGVVVGLTSPISSEIEFYNETSYLEPNYVLTKTFTLYEDSYLDLNFESQVPLAFYFFEERESWKYENGQSAYYLDGGEWIDSLSWDDNLLDDGVYVIRIESFGEGGIYSLNLETDNYY